MKIRFYNSIPQIYLVFAHRFFRETRNFEARVPISNIKLNFLYVASALVSRVLARWPGAYKLVGNRFGKD